MITVYVTVQSISWIVAHFPCLISLNSRWLFHFFRLISVLVSLSLSPSVCFFSNKLHLNRSITRRKQKAFHINCVVLNRWHKPATKLPTYRRYQFYQEFRSWTQWKKKFYCHDNWTSKLAIFCEPRYPPHFFYFFLSEKKFVRAIFFFEIIFDPLKWFFSIKAWTLFYHIIRTFLFSL